MIEYDYQVLMGSDSGELEAQVVRYMEDGYIPTGGVIISAWHHDHNDSGGTTFYQAVYRAKS